MGNGDKCAALMVGMLMVLLYCNEITLLARRSSGGSRAVVTTRQDTKMQCYEGERKAVYWMEY